MLIANLAKGEAELHALESERREIEEALPGLVTEPERYAQAQERLREIQVIAPSKRLTIEAIEKAIPGAEAHEEREALEGRIAEQARQSAKLRRDLAARYCKAAEALAAVLADVEADNRAWEALNLDAREHGLPRRDSAERELRKEAGVRPNGSWYSLTEGIVIRDWSGRVLFGGKVGTYF